MEAADTNPLTSSRMPNDKEDDKEDDKEGKVTKGTGG